LIACAPFPALQKLIDKSKDWLLHDPGRNTANACDVGAPTFLHRAARRVALFVGGPELLDPSSAASLELASFRLRLKIRRSCGLTA
jgi:hypothetical protein